MAAASSPGVNYIVVLLCPGFPFISVLKRVMVTAGWAGVVNVFIEVQGKMPHKVASVRFHVS